jgi:hypothetical protein
MDFIRLFETKDTKTDTVLRRLTDGFRAFSDGHQLHSTEWDRALQYGTDACVFTESVMRQKSVTTRDSQFFFPVLWLQPAMKCNCILALALIPVVELMRQFLLNSVEIEKHDSLAEDRVQWGDRANIILGLASYVCDHVLNVWASFPEVELGMTRERIRGMRAAVRAYALWNTGHRLLMKQQFTSATGFLSYNETDKDAYSQIMILFYTAHHVLKSQVPAKLSLSWGKNTPADLQHVSTNTQNFACSIDKGKIDRLLRANASTTESKSGTSTSWTHRASVDYLVVMGMYYRCTNQPEVSAACYFAAVTNGGHVPQLQFSDFAAVNAQQTNPIPKTVEGFVKMIRLTGAMQVGKKPFEWEHGVQMQGMMCFS